MRNFYKSNQKFNGGNEMALIDLEDKIAEIVNREDHSDFLYELLGVYDVPRATITRLKKEIKTLQNGLVKYT